MKNLDKILALLKEGNVQFINSIIPIFIIVKIISLEEKKESVTFKRLFYELSEYSIVSIKKHLKVLSSDGFINVSTCNIDQRSKIISSTTLLQTINKKITELF